MIYILDFFKGASLALMFFGAFFFFLYFNSILYIFLGMLPGFALVLIFILLIQNYQLKQKQHNNKKKTQDF
ncbi:hypothetical protein OQH60_01520 [Campylobacter sp. MIT 21-1685]|uniref:hypothetical protein n=1 Tax=unclassified Campylobacter TaxID=2593542 RepID=UPI00224B056D|nr:MULTISPECIES: hypothetical protein [unclassified Campylobacter]MCX2682556.1 hypothetical protein [Campylobacter sp. MIT 21-1684]MCX2750731.1 hypothetical protein [Campylobacter sp. MIT 21-1682]MCX2807037.1 hypothetical protein [Campylobacter sp. MIT 21-1685]